MAGVQQQQFFLSRAFVELFDEPLQLDAEFRRAAAVEFLRREHHRFRPVGVGVADKVKHELAAGGDARQKRGQPLLQFQARGVLFEQQLVRWHSVAFQQNVPQPRGVVRGERQRRETAVFVVLLADHDCPRARVRSGGEVYGRGLQVVVIDDVVFHDDRVPLHAGCQNLKAATILTMFLMRLKAASSLPR